MAAVAVVWHQLLLPDAEVVVRIGYSEECGDLMTAAMNMEMALASEGFVCISVGESSSRRNQCLQPALVHEIAPLAPDLTSDQTCSKVLQK